MKYSQCVADTEAVLIGLSKIANIEFTKGELSNFEDSFVDSGKDEELFSLKGKGWRPRFVLRNMKDTFLYLFLEKVTALKKLKLIFRIVAKATNKTQEFKMQKDAFDSAWR